MTSLTNDIGIIECRNCGHKFSGKFCNLCGEKTISESDFSIKNIISQAFGALTDLDSKLLKTFKMMFENPGKLAKQITLGIRVPYLKPFQIFVICNLLFFIFLSDTDLFRTPSKWFFNDNFSFFGNKVTDKAAAIMEMKNLTLGEVKTQYDLISSNLSKSLLILLIPFIASIGLLIRRELKFGKHLIFATVYFSQFLLSTTILYLITTNLPVANQWFFIVPVILVAIAYYVLSIKSFYGKNLLWSLVFGLCGIFIMAILFNFYRTFINIISLALL